MIIKWTDGSKKQEQKSNLEPDDIWQQGWSLYFSLAEGSGGLEELIERHYRNTIDNSPSFSFFLSRVPKPRLNG